MATSPSTAAPPSSSRAAIAGGVAPLRAGQGHSFLLRRLHSLTGIIPVGAFLIGYYTMVVGSNVGLAVVVHRWIGVVSDRVYRGVLLISSLALAVYGLALIGRAAQRER